MKYFIKMAIIILNLIRNIKTFCAIMRFMQISDHPIIKLKKPKLTFLPSRNLTVPSIIELVSTIVK